MFAKGSIWYLYLSILGALLSGLFNFYCFENLFTTVPTVVSVLASILVAGLMYALLWRIEDKDNYLVWVLCAKISVITTVGAVFISQVSSSNAQETVESHVAFKQYMEASLAQDAAAQEVWRGNNRITHAAHQREAMDHRLVQYMEGVQQLEKARNGDALMAEALDKIPAGGGLAFLAVVSLLLALAFDLGPAKCVKIFRDMQAESVRGGHPPRVNRVAKNRTRNDKAPTLDTGTTPGFDSRYQAFEEALRERAVDPNVRSVKQVFGCSYTTAAGYLAAACQHGLLACKVNAQGGKVYRHV
jgi:hypothetical protein